jgi:hypothetical protein
LYWEEDQTYTAMAKTVGFTGGNGDLTYLKWENHYPDCNFLFVKVYLPILLEEYGVVFKQSIPYFGYNQMVLLIVFLVL